MLGFVENDELEVVFLELGLPAFPHSRRLGGCVWLQRVGLTAEDWEELLLASSTGEHCAIVDELTYELPSVRHYFDKIMVFGSEPISKDPPQIEMRS